MKSHSSQSGNIFFYILLGIVLFAALGYAASRSYISTDGVSDEKAKLIATELIAQGNTIKGAVTRMRLRGVQRNELSVANAVMTSAMYNNSNCTSTACRIFDPAGGNVSFPLPISGATNTPDVYWGFYTNLNIENIDTTTSEGYRSQIFMMIADVNKKVCRQINNLLHGVDLNADLTGTAVYPGVAPWDGVLYTSPYSLPESTFSPLLNTKDAFCMPFTNSWTWWTTINAKTTVSIPAGTHYYYIVTLSPSR